jgi:hypothetical protein
LLAAIETVLSGGIYISPAVDFNIQ